MGCKRSPTGLMRSLFSMFYSERLASCSCLATVVINKEIQTADLVSSNKMKYCIIFRNVTSFQDIVNKNSLKLLLRS